MSATEVTTTPVITLTDNAAAKVAELIALEGDDRCGEVVQATAELLLRLGLRLLVAAAAG